MHYNYFYRLTGQCERQEAMEICEFAVHVTGASIAAFAFIFGCSAHCGRAAVPCSALQWVL
jgi:hypothetical protein